MQFLLLSLQPLFDGVCRLFDGRRICIYIRSLILQCLHQISHLRCRKPHFLQLFPVPEHFSGDTVKTNLSLVHNDHTVHIARHIFHAVRNQNDRDSPLLLKPFDLVQDLIPSTRV